MRRRSGLASRAWLRRFETPSKETSTRSFATPGEEYDIRVQYDRLDRASVQDVGNVIVGTKGGVPLRIRDVARTIEGSGPTKIDRKNRQRQIVVSAYLAPGKVIGNMQQEINPKFAKIDFGRTTYKWGGEANNVGRRGRLHGDGARTRDHPRLHSHGRAFQQRALPVRSSCSAIPQALVGGLLGLLVTGKPLSIIAMIGVIMLMGLVTKNAILLVDFTNTLRERGYRREDALIEAGPTRSKTDRHDNAGPDLRRAPRSPSHSVAARSSASLSVS